MSASRVTIVLIGAVSLAACDRGAASPARSTADADVTVRHERGQVRIRQHPGWLAIDRGSTPWPVRVLPYRIENLRFVGQEPFDDFMRELLADATEPVVNINVADDVRVLDVELLRHHLPELGWSTVRLGLARGERHEYVNTPGITFCACAADVPHRTCVQPQVALAPDGVVVRLWPALRGPCRTARAKSGLYGQWDRNTPPSQPPPDLTLPFEHVTRIVKEPMQCISAPRERGVVDQTAVETMLVRGVLLAPGCPYGTVSTSTEIRWGELEAVLSFMALEQGWEPRWFVDPDLDGPFASTGCSDTVLESTLPEAPDDANTTARPRPGCPRGDDD